MWKCLERQSWNGHLSGLDVCVARLSDRSVATQGLSNGGAEPTVARLGDVPWAVYLGLSTLCLKCIFSYAVLFAYQEFNGLPR